MPGMDLRSLTPLLQVYDMPASIRFYRDLLGFRIYSHSPHRGGRDPDRFHWVWLKCGSLDLMLNTAYEFDDERPVPPDPARTAAHGDTALYFDCPDLDAAYEELRTRVPDLAHRTSLDTACANSASGIRTGFPSRSSVGPDRESHERQVRKVSPVPLAIQGKEPVCPQQRMRSDDEISQQPPRELSRRTSPPFGVACVSSADLNPDVLSQPGRSLAASHLAASGV